jgi:hypothetical protein
LAGANCAAWAGLARTGQWLVALLIPFHSISEAETPPTKVSVKKLTVLLQGGSAVELPFLGATERSFDAFEFLRFIDRVVADRK